MHVLRKTGHALLRSADVQVDLLPLDNLPRPRRWGFFLERDVDDDSGWYTITLDDRERPDVHLRAGGFPDTKSALWFVEQIEEFMDWLVSKVDHESDVIDLRTHRGNDTIN